MGKIWRALNHFGIALFVFVTLTGVFLWSTGSLHIGLPAAAEVHTEDDGHGHAKQEADEADEGHDHAKHEGEGHDADEDWCDEHGVPESACTRCNADLIAKFKAKDDWCAEHSLPESQCEACNPGCTKALKEAHAGHDHGGEEEGDVDWCIEHEVPESACTKCNPALVAKLKAKGDWCAEHNLPESQCEACNPGCRAKLKAGGGQGDGLEALAKRQCEHGKPIVSCDECRYQIGVVKVEPGVAKALLRTGKVERREAVRTLRMTGEVQLDQTRAVDVPPPASGRVIAVKASLGQRVGRGDVLAVIHSADFGEAKAAYLGAHTEHEIARKEQERQAALTAAIEKLFEHLAKVNGDAKDKKAAHHTPEIPKQLVGEWKSKLLGAAARLRLAETNHDREKGLWEKGISSKAEHDTARQEWESAQAEYAALVEEVHLSLSLEKLRADNAVRKAEATLNAAEQKLHIFGLSHDDVQGLRDKKNNGDFARLPAKAPRAGTIIAQSASEGKFAETTDSLYTIADLSNLWVWCDLYARDLAVLHAELAKRKTLPAAVRVASFPDTTFPGTVDLVGSIVDEHTRTVKVRVQASNLDGKLKPGMFATVEVTVPSGKEVALVPREAVLSDEDKRFVFQHWRDDLWVRRDVVVGEVDDRTVQILAGLREGAAIATGGGFMLKSDVLRNKMGAG